MTYKSGTYYKPVRTALDANHVICWRMDGASGDVANTGSGGTCALSPLGGGSVRNFPGLFGGAALVGTSVTATSWFATARPAPINIPLSFTMDLWVNLQQPGSTTGWRAILAKKYAADATYLSPYHTANLYGIQMAAAVATGAGVLNRLAYDGTPNMAYRGGWNHIGLTYDNSTKEAKFYANGGLIEALTTAATLDRGTNGEWIVGSRRRDAGEETPCAIVEDIRISDVVRAQAYFQTIFKSAMSPLGMCQVP